MLKWSKIKNFRLQCKFWAIAENCKDYDIEDNITSSVVVMEKVDVKVIVRVIGHLGI